MRSAKRNTTGGLTGRLMEMFGKVTGRNSPKGRGRSTRTRGAGRRQAARTKRAVR